MKKIKEISLVLAISGSLIFTFSDVFAAEEDAAGIMDGQTTIDKQDRDDAQRALALSKRPRNVGQEVLNQESDGLYGLPQQALDNWAMGRMFPAHLN